MQAGTTLINKTLVYYSGMVIKIGSKFQIVAVDTNKELAVLSLNGQAGLESWSFDTISLAFDIVKKNKRNLPEWF